MPIFVSYSHADKEKIDLIAGHLLRKRTSLWIDRWELRAGDSIINQVQEAVEGSSALLIMLSKASVESEWCKKELTAGLFRELDEKRVVTIPVLLDDCKIPIFLKDKMYADFRTDFDAGMSALLESVAQFSNSDQSRLEDTQGYLDWSCDYGLVGESYFVNYILVQSSEKTEMSFVTEIHCVYNDVATRRQMRYVENGVGWMGRTTNAFLLLDFAERSENEMFLILDSPVPQHKKFKFYDSKTGSETEVIVKARKMGNDNGKDQLINITDYFRRIVGYVTQTERKPTPEELETFKAIQMSPWQ
ncbi:toll/interleukin-1 receptor domain-containing protein [Pseudomonas viridiflava]|uniref:Toll/interleukin-1 receptor domain-containing protein n=1 Tax=Pseudomonas viridiflava TaxID=33069 RepID=A0AA46VUM8_PSEVI|nr:toll/interleukin-1 receptor domain-containing protein [Pseudomonas viridiflava]UZA68214.1 toll/interleukin-1 receptor domain-containing protein [Pseudomonas viridiflava]